MKRYILLLSFCLIFAGCSVDNSPPHIPAKVYPSEIVTCNSGEEHHIFFTGEAPLTLEKVVTRKRDGIHTQNHRTEDSEYIRFESRELLVQQSKKGGAIEVKITKEASAAAYIISTSIPTGLTDEKGWIFLAPSIMIEMK